MSSRKQTIHTKRYYKVVLDHIGESDSPESFALKLSMRMRTPLPRVRQVVARLPYTIKKGLDAEQANRFKGALERLGATAHIETYFVEPGETRHIEQDRSPPRVDGGSATPASTTCPECGWEEEGGATYCSMCFRRFRDEERRSGLGANLPHDNPLGTMPFRSSDAVPATLAERRWVLIGAAAAVVVVLFILLIK